jgi:hypothetical protein
VRIDYQFAPNLAGAVEAVRFAAGDAIRAAGGKGGTYLGVELRYAWRRCRPNYSGHLA